MNKRPCSANNTLQNWHILIKPSNTKKYFNKWPRCEKACLQGLKTTKAEPAFISTFVITLVESIISKLATKQNFYFLANLCSGADWFGYDLVGTSKDMSVSVCSQFALNK